jgi:hypothetical protein
MLEKRQLNETGRTMPHRSEWSGSPSLGKLMHRQEVVRDARMKRMRQLTPRSISACSPKHAVAHLSGGDRQKTCRRLAGSVLIAY